MGGRSGKGGEGASPLGWRRMQTAGPLHGVHTIASLNHHPFAPHFPAALPRRTPGACASRRRARSRRRPAALQAAAVPRRAAAAAAPARSKSVGRRVAAAAAAQRRRRAEGELALPARCMCSGSPYFCCATNLSLNFVQLRPPTELNCLSFLQLPLAFLAVSLFWTYMLILIRHVATLT